MKFIHISDLHILPRPQTIQGIDVCARLAAAVDSIRAEFADAEFCMVTGDLSDDGNVASYREVRRILDRLPMPWHPLMGNHDARQPGAREVFPEFPWQPDGSLQYALETDAGQFIVLDSSVRGGIDSGRLSAARLGFLRDQLAGAKAAGRDAYLFMHHVPFDIGIGWLDGMKLENADELWHVLREFDNVRHMFFGHIHRPTHGSWHGIAFSSVRAVAHQVALRLGDKPREFIAESPSFAVVLIGEDQVLIHDHDFLKNSPTQ